MCVDLDWEAWLRAIAGVITVNAIAEGPDAGGHRGEGQVVVIKLAKEGEDECVLTVSLNILFQCGENAV